MRKRPAAEVLSYDDDGNLTGDWRWTYVWDRENRLMSMTTTSTAVAAGAPNLRLDYVYDGFGRRVMKRVSRRNTAVTAWVLEEEMRFIYEGWNLLAEVSTLKPGSATARAVQPVRSYLWGEDLSGTETGAGGVGGLLMVRQHAAAAGESWTGWQVPCLDGNGNVLAYLDADSGEVMSRFEYDPFGRTVVAESVARYSKKGTAAAKRVPVEAPPFRFSTKYEDGETGLVYYGYRYYSPEWGRWVNRDPIREYGGLNLYLAIANNMVCGIDYLGMLEISISSPAISRMPNGDTKYKSIQELYQKYKKRIRYGEQEFKDYPDTAGYVVQSANIAILGPEKQVKDGKVCYIIKKGNIFHNVSVIAVKREGERGTVGHEMQHIRSFALQIKRVADLYRGVTDNVKWSDEKTAIQARRQFERAINSVLAALRSDNASHAPSGFDHSNDPWGLERPGTHEDIPFDYP